MTDRPQTTISPVDGSVYDERPLHTDEQIDTALEAAARAQRSWRHVSVEERVDVVLRAVDWLVERADDLGAELTWQMGRPVSQSPGELRRGFLERAAYMGRIATEALSDLRIEPADGIERFIRPTPLGVVLVLAPWNYPWLSSVNAVVPALLAGNSVVLKVASQTPRVGDRYAEAFAHAGLPEGLFAHVVADHDGVAEMIGDPRVGFVAFTGSVPGGHAVQRAAAQRFIASNLELGGKDPAYVRPDADLARTIEELADGAFFNAGQSCCGVERIYAHRDVFDQVVDGLVEAAHALKLADPTETTTTLGPMVRTSAATFVREQIDEAVKQGARTLVDSSRFARDEPGTPYLAPQVVVDVDHSMRLMTEETFGPVVGVMAVASDDEAVMLMNDSPYGLTASVWTADVDAAVAIGDRVDTGTWYLNRCDYLDPALAWTGVKDSGRGVSLSRLAYEALTRPKSFHLRTAL
ncbi:MAG: aldehyde dehydrogenase family protein [Actinobacteria bacterium]|nr:aldehyde dehydrogenase family protein [Actinomycetota bacterium]